MSNNYDRYDEFVSRFADYSTEELVDTFNKDVGNPGWTSSRAAHCSALMSALASRNIDLSPIRSEGGGYSWARRVRLNDLGAVELAPLPEPQE